MRVFVAGGTGVLPRRLVPQLLARGHQVTATTTTAGKVVLLEQLGAEGIMMRSTTSRTWSSRQAARSCATAGFYGPGANDDQVKLVQKRLFRSSGAAPATSHGCISTTRRAPPSWRWSSRQRACSTSSTTNPPRSASGCPISRSAPGKAAPAGP